MDYEKKYKEALSRAKAKYNMQDQPIHQDLVDILPELAESVDEEIRKAIIKHFQEGCSRPLSVDLTSALAWLEKQGEQKPNNRVESATKSYITPNSKFFQWIYDRLIYVHHENPDVDYMHSLKERIEDMQKPAWSE